MEKRMERMEFKSKAPGKEKMTEKESERETGKPVKRSP